MLALENHPSFGGTSKIKLLSIKWSPPSIFAIKMYNSMINVRPCYVFGILLVSRNLDRLLLPTSSHVMELFWFSIAIIKIVGKVSKMCGMIWLPKECLMLGLCFLEPKKIWSIRLTCKKQRNGLVVRVFTLSKQVPLLVKIFISLSLLWLHLLILRERVGLR